MTASIQKSSTLNFRKQKNKIVIRHSDIEDMNPSIPDEGEVVYATDTNELYIGDGLTKVEELSPISGGGSGSTNYNELTNKPKINDVTLSGNKTAEDLGLASAAEGALAVSAIQPGDDISDLNNDAGYITGIDSGDVTTALGYTPADSSSLATVATTGDYDDLLNKPTIPAAQVQSDWDQADTDAVDYIKNKPYIPAGVVIDQTYDPTSTNGQSGTAVAEAVSTKVTANTAITGATKCKITYDSKGLVISGADLEASDIPSLTLSKLSDVTASASEVNVLDGITASTSELNVLDGITASTTELNYVDGVTSSIQSQLDGKVSSVSSANKVYATDNNNSDTTISYTTANTASTIVQRDSNSQVNVNLTPSDNTHATSKKYVDDKFDTAITEAVVFQGIVADQTQLPSTGNTNGDLYWITEFVSPAPTGMTVGDSGAAIWNAKLATPQWQYTEDAIYQPDDATIELNANAKLSVKLSNSANNSLTTDANGLIVDISGKLDKNNAITGATKCKITYDSKGLVTAGADITLSDVSDVTASATEVNVLDGITASTTELNYTDGVTSNIQTQLNGKLQQFSDMPVDPSLYDGQIVQFTGDPASGYTPGYFYQAYNMTGDPMDPMWTWENVSVQYTPTVRSVPSSTSSTDGKPLVSTSSSYAWNDTISYPLKFVNTSSTAVQLTIGRGSTTSRYMYFKPSSTSAQMNIGFGSTDYYILTTSVFRPNTNAGASLGNASYKWSSLYVNYAYINYLYDSNYMSHSLLSMPVYFNNINDYVPGEMIGNYDGKIMQFTGPDSTYYDATTQTNKPVKRGYFYLGTYDSMNDSMSWDQIDVQPREIPSQTGQSGKFLTTDGSSLSWATVSGGSSTLASLTDVSISSPSDGQMLYYDAMDDAWYNGNAPKEVMFAVYGTTTYAAIKSWMDNGYYVVCKRNDYYGALYYYSDSVIGFCYVASDVLYNLTVNTSNSWSNTSKVVAQSNQIKPIVMDFSVDSSTGAITCTFNKNPTNKSVHTVIGNTSIAGTWSGSGTAWVFTPTTADDILDNANGFVVTVS